MVQSHRIYFCGTSTKMIVQFKPADLVISWTGKNKLHFLIKTFKVKPSINFSDCENSRSDMLLYYIC